MTTFFNLVVTCCDHPDNEYDWIPGAVWACNWSDESVQRDPVVMISQIVPLADGEARRFIEDWTDDGPVHHRLMTDNDGTPIRERIRESCAACNRTLTMRDDTWNELSSRLELLPELWRPMPEMDDPEGDRSFEATISLPMMARLAEELRSRRGRDQS